MGLIIYCHKYIMTKCPKSYIGNNFGKSKYLDMFLIAGVEKYYMQLINILTNIINRKVMDDTKDIQEQELSNMNSDNNTADKNAATTDQKAEKKAEKKSKKYGRGKKQSKEDKLKEELKESQEKIAELNDKYLRLYSEFDNYRKRTIKEKADIYKTAGEDVILSIISIIDDFERALKATADTEENRAHREGMELIYNKFKKALEQKGVEEIKAIGEIFDTDLHEALTKVPAPSEDLKSKVLDVIEKGYTMNDKVIRFAKVVVGD